MRHKFSGRARLANGPSAVAATIEAKTARRCIQLTPCSGYRIRPSRVLPGTRKLLWSGTIFGRNNPRDYRGLVRKRKRGRAEVMSALRDTRGRRTEGLKLWKPVTR